MFNEKVPNTYPDAEAIKAACPWLSEKRCKRLAMLNNAVILTDEQQEAYLRLHNDGVAHTDILYRLDVTPNSYQLTKNCRPVFNQALAFVKKNRPKQIESASYKYATGKCKVVKKIYKAELDEFGEPVRDAEGKQKFFMRAKEVTNLPPSATLIKFLLELQQGKEGEEGYVSPADLVKKLDEVMRRKD